MLLNRTLPSRGFAREAAHCPERGVSASFGRDNRSCSKRRQPQQLPLPTARPQQFTPAAAIVETLNRFTRLPLVHPAHAFRPLTLTMPSERPKCREIATDLGAARRPVRCALFCWTCARSRGGWGWRKRLLPLWTSTESKKARVKSRGALRICMYGHDLQQIGHQPSRVCQSCSWSAEQGEKYFFPNPCSRLRIGLSRQVRFVPTRVSPLIRHTSSREYDSPVQPLTYNICLCPFLQGYS